MAEYISREEAIKELREVYENEYPTASGDFDEYASHDVPNVLRNMKASDVHPVRRGKWLKRMSTSESLKCSICENNHDYPTTYCPNCGARMKEG